MAPQFDRELRTLLRAAGCKQLQEHIDAFMTAYNENAQPFAWKKKKVFQRRFKTAVSLSSDSGY